ncbi:hypothetical protein BSA171_15745 [Bacillus safensis]|uniref:hypothetical protein n=1 Tax=Bacillus safensis TaxID=561879 RepID=UPI00094BDFC8|nr:hypothetical protein [Bacillus safensis]APT48778.1 hypothetical protein BSA41_01970 [Bacillus safensis]APT54944.1 hypothetical protein BSA171_15745 [Bacillus safensis]
MEQAALKKMRTKQVVISNLLFGVMLLIFFVLIQKVEIQFTYFFLCLGIFMLLQGIYGLNKKGSTKSFIPIFEQVAIYEKEKLGKEWEKEQRVENIWKLMLSGLMFFQSFSLQTIPDSFFEIELKFLIFLFVMALALINISMLFRFRKIDRSTEAHGLKGFTKDSNMLAMALGILSAIVIFGFIVIFLLP